MSGAATDLMGEVADAFIAPWVVPGADESTKWSCQRRKTSTQNGQLHLPCPSTQRFFLPALFIAHHEA